MNAFQKFLQLVVVSYFFLPSVSAKEPSPITIKPVANATHIAAITKDTIVVITGSTYRFTVDTREDQGLVSTLPTVNELLAQITAGNGVPQQYKVTDRTGNAKTDGDIVTGDRLIVSSQNSKVTKTYHLLVKPMALTGKLELEQQAITVNTTKDLILYYTAGQRSPDATVNIYLPAGIKVA